MKKIYCQPEWELLVVQEDVLTASGDYDFDPDGFLEKDSVDNWEW